MGILPEVSDVKAIKYDYFPTPWQAVVWRNWGYLPVERIAGALQTTVENIKEAASLLGLDPEETVNPEWEKRGYLTTIRENWHLCTYEQILILLQISEEDLAFILKEDDFMWVKLGGMKPEVEAPKYRPLTEDELAQTKKIAALWKDRFPAGFKEKDNAFDFLEKYKSPVKDEALASKIKSPEKEKTGTEGLRMVYPYFAIYGDALIDESIDPLPERILKEYAQAGINGIWMQMVLYQMVEFPFDPSLSAGWEKRIESLRRLAARAKKYGIGIYPYLNEPRAMQASFFSKYPHLQGESEDGLYAMCTSAQEVRDYLYRSVRTLFEMVPELAGFVTITMSENLTNCYSRVFVEEGAGIGETSCPRCKNRKPWEVVAEVNNLMAKGAHDAAPKAKTIVWTWGWPDEWAEKVIPLLTEHQIIQCTSEEALPFCIGGIEGRVKDYTMSLCGPSQKAKRLWKTALDHNLEVSAKVQINNTWEIAAVPYIPVFDKIARHVMKLKEQGIAHLHASWTLGGSPSPNLRLTAWLMDERGTVRDFLADWLGKEVADGVYTAQQKLSKAFSSYPFALWSLYLGPQNYGPMAPFFLKDTGYSASMIGFPYDDAKGWRSIYPPDIYEKQYGLLCAQWKNGVESLETYIGCQKELDELIFMAKAVLGHFESAYHHIRFVNCRNAMLHECDMGSGKQEATFEQRDAAIGREELISIIREEMETVQEMISLRMEDSRLGYESSNHYFYTLQDLREKMINLAFCEEKIEER